ncbi:MULTISPECIES: OmpA family protein [Deinococcus]|uniref:OmpA-like domain-containing protein n=1 Tax=Deinococcus daejeonensis TaxID=1007098 RepID=A0ABQ2JGU6_9DEIO|nr:MULTISPECIES: OmpA family protein [Deinococcus]RIY03030.1 cell envelope biogenesis protein OmpA [Deinococcus sp. RM]GGN47277.1 hypothetical protein GCM10010842_38640 [Deinococcus daejeonensis]
MSRRTLPADDLNPYVALTDTTLNVILVMVFVVAALTALTRVNWENLRYQDAQTAFQEALKDRIPAARRPVLNRGKNDPVGTQRWVFTNTALFKPGSVNLSPGGRATLGQFAQALRENRGTWRRIRIEGHTLPTLNRTSDRWEDATNRAAAAARFLVTQGGIEPYFIATAGRGGQNPLPDLKLTAPDHARIEIVLEYTNSAPAGARP